MVFPRQLSSCLTGYLLRNRLRNVRRFPLVLMLEPTFRCNLACSGCGRIREYRDILDQMLSVEECLSSVDEAAAPVVCLTGGEPLIHPGIEQIVQGILARKRFVYLSSNGLVLKDSLSRFKPSPYFSFVIHIDGLAETHDRMAGHPGLFERATLAIKVAKSAGFQVYTNTTIYKGIESAEIDELFVSLARLGVDGLIVAPAFSYDAVASDVFLSREEAIDIFRPIYERRRSYPFYSTPLYLEFLAGQQQFTCMPWSNPTRNPKGWKRPCYLITDAHCQSFRELIEETRWQDYGTGNDQRCANCMVHCGFEASALDKAGRSLSGIWKMVKWNYLENR